MKQEYCIDLSFNYKGSFKPGASLVDLIDEVADIAHANEWRYSIFNDIFPEDAFETDDHDGKLYGISFTPPLCDTVWLCFLSNGKMSNPENLDLFGGLEHESFEKVLYWLNVITHNAGVEMHKKILDILRYLDKKYFKDFEVTDVSHYWESGDEKVMKETLNFSASLFEAYVYGHEYPLQPGESEQDYWTRVTKFMFGIK